MSMYRDYRPITLHYGTKAKFNNLNPIMDEDTVAMELQPGTDNILFKFGDGKTAWVDLPYFGGGVADVEVDSRNHLIITNSDGVVKDAGDLTHVVSLDNYYTKEQINNMINVSGDTTIDGSSVGLTSTNIMDAVLELASTKVTADGDKCLSTNDFDNTYKEALDDIIENGVVTDIPDWAKEENPPTYCADDVEAVAITANQSLTDTQQANARCNIGLDKVQNMTCDEIIDTLTSEKIVEKLGYTPNEGLSSDDVRALIAEDKEQQETYINQTIVAQQESVIRETVESVQANVIAEKVAESQESLIRDIAESRIDEKIEEGAVMTTDEIDDLFN